MQQQWPLTSLHFCDQKLSSAIRAKIPNIWRAGSFLPTPDCHKLLQAALGSLAQLPAMWLRCGGWVTATVEELKLIKFKRIYHPSLPLEVTSLEKTPEFQVVAPDRFFQCSCCLGRERDSWCFLLYHLLRILSQSIF